MGAYVAVVAVHRSNNKPLGVPNPMSKQSFETHYFPTAMTEDIGGGIIQFYVAQRRRGPQIWGFLNPHLFFIAISADQIDN